MQMALKIVIGLLALMFVALGVGVIYDPASAPEQFGVEALGVTGLSTLRGDLGGMFIAAAVLLVWGVVSGRTTFYLAVAVLMLAIAGGRLIGFVADGTSPQVILPFIVELVTAAILLTAHLNPPTRAVK